jgi:hypothetical protein
LTSSQQQPWQQQPGRQQPWQQQQQEPGGWLEQQQPSQQRRWHCRARAARGGLISTCLPAGQQQHL